MLSSGRFGMTRMAYVAVKTDTTDLAIDVVESLSEAQLFSFFCLLEASQPHGLQFTEKLLEYFRQRVDIAGK